MRLPILMMSVIVLFNLGLDYYIWHTIKDTCNRKKILSRLYVGSTVLLVVFILIAIALPRKSGSDSLLVADMWMIYVYFTIYIPKLLFCLISWAFLPFRKKHRRAWLSANIAGVTAAFLVFAVMWWGAAINRISYSIKNIDIASQDIPTGFNGYKILQFSDLHCGTYGNDTAYVDKIVKEINAQKPDLVVFTGDIVNRRTDELYPFVRILSKIKAHDGVISILGNHDYGDYSNWPDSGLKLKNMQEMISLHEKMGWNLLRNKSRIIGRNNDSIAIIGVENWGEPPFKTYGNLKASYPALGDSVFKILLTHNPVHWEQEVMNNDSANIALSLSGHTHAMQIEIGRWSPAEWRYSRWGGLYESPTNNGKHLYVNIGLGTVGIPSRIGATPELTIITLHR